MRLNASGFDAFQQANGLKFAGREWIGASQP
jgi:hypothetical protein